MNKKRKQIKRIRKGQGKVKRVKEDEANGRGGKGERECPCPMEPSFGWAERLLP